MTRPTPPKSPEAEAEFTRKMVLGILGTLESKGLLSKGEVDSIILAARNAAYPPPPTPKSQVAPPRKVRTEWPGGVNQINPSAIAGLPATPPARDDAKPEELPVIDMQME